MTEINLFKDNFHISNNKAKIDVLAVHQFLAYESY